MCSAKTVRRSSFLHVCVAIGGAAGFVLGDGASAALAGPVEPERVQDLEVMRGGIWRVGPTYISGQPTEETLKALSERGVRAVISVRTTREMSDKVNVPFDEPAVVEGLGMEYVNLGLGGAGTYSPATLARLHEVMEKHDGRVLLHCTVGARATIAWAALQTRYHGVALKDALEQGYEMAMGPTQFEQMLGEKIEWRLTGEASDSEKGWLVDGEWLAENAPDRGVRILDVRPAYVPYFEGHCAGAAHFDAHALRGARDGVPAQFRSNEDMAAIFGLAGVTPSNRVVVYAEGGDILSSTMTMFALEKLGHLNSSLLDGGLESVKQSGLVSQAYPAGKPDKFPAFENLYCSVALEDVRAGLSSGDVFFVDARPTEQYEGKTNVWQRNGHIPGAVNVFWKRLTTDENTHRLRAREEMRSIFESAGATPEKEIVVYCGTGREASLLYMVLTRELRYPNVRLYEGGWTEYAAAEGVEVEK